MPKIGIIGMNVLQGPYLGVLQAYMYDHKLKYGCWPSVWQSYQMLEEKGFEPDEWDVRYVHYKTTEVLPS